MDKELTEAIPIYLGLGVSSRPSGDVDRLREKFGAARAVSLRDRIEALLKEADQLGPTWMPESGWAPQPETLVDLTNRMLKEMARRHPDLGSSGLEAIGWSFSYDHK